MLVSQECSLLRTRKSQALELVKEVCGLSELSKTKKKEVRGKTPRQIYYVKIAEMPPTSV